MPRGNIIAMRRPGPIVSLKRLKGWGFATVGGWSDTKVLRQSKEMSLWLTPVLHIGSTAGAPWWDMWDAKVIRRMDEVARGQLPQCRTIRA